MWALECQYTCRKQDREILGYQHTSRDRLTGVSKQINVKEINANQAI